MVLSLLVQTTCMIYSVFCVYTTQSKQAAQSKSKVCSRGISYLPSFFSRVIHVTTILLYSTLQPCIINHVILPRKDMVLYQFLLCLGCDFSSIMLNLWLIPHNIIDCLYYLYFYCWGAPINGHVYTFFNKPMLNWYPRNP